jgi:short-subunit dehydrogenase
MKEKRPVILITGASTGLGLCLTKKLLQLNQYHIIATARESSLTRFANEGISEDQHLWIRKLDVTNHGHAYDIVAEANKKLNGIDILVNNAGVSFRSVVEHITDDELSNQMNINFKAPMELTRIVLPKMREKRFGKIINISSVGGMMAMPTMAAYSASKFALEGSTESLWYEVKPFGIHVSLVQPGFINSEGFTHTRLTELANKTLDKPKSDYYCHYKYMANFIAKMMTNTPSDASDVADRIIRIIKMKSPPLRVAGTWDAWFFGALRRLLPRGLYHWLLYRNLPGIRHWGQNSCDL